jgi:hypothetical protein
MSIRTKLINKLKTEFLFGSAEYRYLGALRDNLKNKMADVIYKYSVQEIPGEDLKVLSKLSDYWHSIRIQPGLIFRNIFGGISLDPEMENEINRSRGYDYCEVRVPEKYYNEYNRNCLSVLHIPEEILPELIEINNKVIETENKLVLARRSWDRLINKNTNKTWLKTNFPDIYARLKDLEKTYN